MVSFSQALAASVLVSTVAATRYAARKHHEDHTNSLSSCEQENSEQKVLVSIVAEACSAIVTPITVTATATSTVTVTSTTTTSMWPYATDTTVWSALSELPEDLDTYTAYAKVMASTEDAMLTWFYNGFSTPLGDGFPETVGSQSQTCEIFNVTHTSATSFRVDWDEMIILSDYATQDPIKTLYNPITGVLSDVPNYYMSGGVTWFVEKNGTGVDITIAQSGAVMKKTSIKGYVYNDMVVFIHYEEKQYSPATDGYYVETTLMPTAKLADVRNASLTSIDSSGNYYTLFTGDVGRLTTYYGLPNGTQGEIHLLGTIEKGDMYGKTIGNSSNQLNPKIWAEMQQHFPTYFTEDLAVTYNYSALFNASGPLM